MTYTPQTWADNDPRYPLSAARLAHIEAGIVAAGTSGGGGIANPLTADLDAGGFNITNMGDITITGLTGATAATRLVGGTVSGAPVSGTFAAGDFVVDQSGKIWVCTVLGSPGTWVSLTPTDATLSTTDVTTNNVSSTKHGFAPKSVADATKFLNSAATPAYAQVKDSDLALTDVTTNNATTSQHGFVKRLSSSATDYFGGDGNYTALPVQAANTVTLTNKRVTKRTGTTASSATPTINTDNVDFYSITALAAAVTSFTTNLSGTPTDGQTLWLAVTDNGTARALTFGASFEASTVALPTTTVISTRLDIGFVWNTATSKWRCVAVA